MARAKGSAKGASAKKRKRAKKPPKCKGKNKDGSRCKNNAKPGHTLCGIHHRYREGGHQRSKLEDDNVQAAVLSWLTQGAYAKEAVEAAGSSVSALHRYLDIGKADEKAGRKSKAREFWEAFREATSAGMLALFADARRAASNGDGRLALEMLSRKDPEQWGKRKRLEHSGPGGGPIPTEPASIDPDKLSLEERRQFVELHRKAATTPENKESK